MKKQKLKKLLKAAQQRGDSASGVINSLCAQRKEVREKLLALADSRVMGTRELQTALQAIAEDLRPKVFIEMMEGTLTGVFPPRYDSLNTVQMQQRDNVTEPGAINLVPTWQTADTRAKERQSIQKDWDKVFSRQLSSD